jgi:hypothetical protein
MLACADLDNHIACTTRSRKRSGHLLVLAAFVLLSIVLTYPLSRDLSSRILGPPAPGDSFEYLYKVWWFTHSLFELTPANPFFNEHMFHPFGYPVTLSETTLSNTIPALPLTLLAGEVAAYNLTLLGTFVLSALGMYLLVLRWTHSRWAGFISGIVFAFCPYRLSHLGAGHLPLMGTQWLPFLLLYLDRMVVGRRRRDGAMAALFYSLGALSAWYYAYIFALAGIAFVLLRARPWRELLWNWQFASSALTFSLLCLALLGPLVWPVTQLWQEGSRPTSLKYVDSFSASPLDFVYPNVLHPWWGSALVRIYGQNPNENVLYLGAIPLLLATAALCLSRLAPRGAGSQPAGRTRPPREVVQALGWISLIFVILSLGTTLHWKGAPLYISVPSAVERVFTAGMSLLTGRLALYPVSSYSLRLENAIYVPLPTLLLYLFLPFFNAMRVWGRFGIISMAGVAALAGIGWKWLESGSALAARRRRFGVNAIRLTAIGLIIMEFAAVPYAMGTSAVTARPVDQWLASQPGDWAIMEFPVAKAVSGRTLYASRTHGKQIAFGYGTFFPREFNEARPVLEDFPSPQCLGLLKSWGVRYVLVGSQSYGTDWPRIESACARASGLRYVLQAEDAPVYEGDRVLRWIPGTWRAFIVDRVYVYEVL